MNINVLKIKEMLDILDVFSYYGFEPNNKGFLCCPFHNEKTPSMKIFKNTNSFYCFGCGISGDAISFVQKMFNLDFGAAINKLNEDFNLGLNNGTRLRRSQRLENSRKLFEHKRALQKAKNEKQERYERYFKAYDNYVQLENQIKKYSPKIQDEPLHPLFVKAISEREFALYQLEQAEMELRINNE